MSTKELTLIKRDCAIYFAGLFDGEGCVNICEHQANGTDKRQKSSYIRASISLANSNHAVMLHVKQTCGGIIAKSKRIRIRKDGKPCKQMYRWSASSRESAHILHHIIPFLIVKKQQAALALEYYEHVMKHISVPHPGILGHIPTSPSELEVRRTYMRKMQALNHPSN